MNRKKFRKAQIEVHDVFSFQIYKMVNDIVSFLRILISNVKITKLYNLRKPTFNEVGKEIYCKHNKRNEGNQQQSTINKKNQLKKDPFC